MNNASSAFVIPCLVISLLNISYDKYMYDVNEMNMKLCFTLCLFDHMTMEGGPVWGRLADQEMAANPIKISSKTEKQGILWTLDINTGILYQICVDWGKSYDHYITLISTNFQDRPQNWKLCWQTSPRSPTAVSTNQRPGNCPADQNWPIGGQGEGCTTWGKDDSGGGGTAALPTLHHLLIHQLLVIAGTALSKTSACSELLTVMMIKHFFVSKKNILCDKSILFLTIVARVQGLPSRGNQSHKQGEAMQDNPPIGQLTINALQ